MRTRLHPMHNDPDQVISADSRRRGKWLLSDYRTFLDNLTRQAEAIWPGHSDQSLSDG